MSTFIERRQAQLAKERAAIVDADCQAQIDHLMSLSREDFERVQKVAHHSSAFQRRMALIRGDVPGPLYVPAALTDEDFI